MQGKSLSGKKMDQSIVAPTTYEWAILRGLQRKQMYAGTVAANVKASRRARGKVAKASRKGNRGQR